jgi:glycosyltransferase involved in cell wall biosynthesis
MRSAALKPRIAFIISHPIQYYAPLHQRLAARGDLEIKVFFTWHSGETSVIDRGFQKSFSWDIPLTDGYAFERVPNTAADPGTHHFFGLRNPELVDRVAAWRPECVVIQGWAWLSHLQALWAFHRRGTPILFRGDSHLLDSDRAGPLWHLKRAALQRFFSWPAGFLVVGTANYAYYEAFGVESSRLFSCPHSIDLARFASDAESFENAAARWRHSLDLAPRKTVLLFAGKFEPKKRPIELMKLVRDHFPPNVVLVMVGGGQLQHEVDQIAAGSPDRFRVLPFQNQSRMPVVYRLGDIFLLPSAYGETWGLAVNEALACGRPVVVSDRVGCAADVVDPHCGRVFPWEDMGALKEIITNLTVSPELGAMGRAATKRAEAFDISVTERAIARAVAEVAGR